PRRTEMKLVERGQHVDPSTALGPMSFHPGPDQPGQARRLYLDPEEIRKWRAGAPRRPLEVGPVEEEAEQFVVRILLRDEPGDLSFAVYAVPKPHWDEWWKSMESDLDEYSITAVANTKDSLPAGPIACPPDDTWVPGNQAWQVEGR